MIKDDLVDSALFTELTHQLLRARAGFRFEAKGRSMWPTIADGDLLYVHAADFEKLRVGDIVLLNGADGMKAHRIICRREDSFITRGDAGVEADGKVTREQVLGKVVAKECRSTARVLRLSDTWDRARFFWRELRRWLSF
jgi:signal peptidase I